MRTHVAKHRRTGGSVLFGYHHLRLSSDASGPPKVALAKLAPSASACSEEPVFEACLVDGSDGGVIFFPVPARVRVPFDLEAMRIENINMTKNY